MSTISNSKKRSAVKLVINLLSVSSLITPAVSFAQPAPSGVQVQISSEDYKADRIRQECNSARDKISEAERAIGAACRKAGLGSGTNCVAKAESCAETIGSEEFSTTDAIGTVLGLPINSSLGSSCPQMNGRDYYDEIKRLNQEVKDTEKDIADLGQEKADIEKEFNEKIADLQQALTDAQQELEKTKEDLDAEEREQLASFQQAQVSNNEQLRARGSELISLRSARTAALRNKATKMLELTAETSKYTCNGEYLKAAKEYGNVSGTSSKNHISKAKAQKAAALDAYQKCLNRFQQARIKVGEDTQAEIEALDDKIRSAESSIDELNDTLKLASTQLQQMKDSTAKKKTAAEKKVTDLMTLTQQKMTAAQQELQTRLQALATRQASLQKALTTASNELMTLKSSPAPKKSAEYTADEASSEISGELAKINGVIGSADPSCNLESSLASAKAKKASRESSKTRGKR